MNSSSMTYDVVVIGGGHAGCEAAAAAARLGGRIALITQNPAKIGEMSCNPATGGVGKGHLVREIDALDGLMGRVADRAGIQFRLLNRRKGPAVRGPRAQADRKLYREAMQTELASIVGLAVIAGEAADLIIEENRVGGVTTTDGRTIRAGAVVVTTGTFLRGLIHLGDKSWPAGRVGDAAAVRLAVVRALGRLSPAVLETSLRERLGVEDDPDVRRAIVATLRALPTRAEETSALFERIADGEGAEAGR